MDFNKTREYKKMGLLKMWTCITAGVTFSTEYGVLYQGSAELKDPSNFLDLQNILNKEKEVLHKRKNKCIWYDGQSTWKMNSIMKVKRK